MSIRQARQGASGATPSRNLTPAELASDYNAKTLVLWGKNDHGSLVKRGYRLFEAIPGAELHAFDNCGHWPMWDQTERFVSVVAGFLKGS